MKKDKGLATIYAYHEKHGRMPSYSEVAELFGYASKFAAFKKVKEYLDQGLIAKDDSGKLLPTKSYSKKETRIPVTVLGTVEAGFGSAYEEELGGSTSLDDWMIPHKASTYMLRVSGDSMMDAGILDGDMLLVEKTKEAKLGEIIIAEIDGAYTVKYLRKDKKGFYLEAANKEYPNLYPQGELLVIAKVIGSLRKYVS